MSRLRGDGRSLVYKSRRLLILCVFGVMLAVLICAGRIVMTINIDSWRVDVYRHCKSNRPLCDVP